MNATRQSDANDDRVKEAYEKTPQYHVAFNQLQYAIGDYMNDGYTEASKYLADAFDKVMEGTESAKDALGEAKEQADSVLKQ